MSTRFQGLVKILNGIHLHLMDILAELLLGGLNVNRLYSRIHEIERNNQEGRGFSIQETKTSSLVIKFEHKV